MVGTNELLAYLECEIRVRSFLTPHVRSLRPDDIANKPHVVLLRGEKNQVRKKVFATDAHRFTQISTNHVDIRGGVGNKFRMTFACFICVVLYASVAK